MPSTTSRIAALAALASLLPAQGDLLYTINNTDGNVRAFDIQLGATVATVPIIAGANGATQCNGMTRDPTTGTVYVLARFPGSNARQLCTLDVVTGAAAIIAPMSDNFSGLACRIDGTLFGVTGDGANIPETLYTIDKTTAVATLVTPLGNGNDGETIGFADDLFLYHASGYATPVALEVFERIDTFGSNTITGVPMSGYDYSELTALTSYTGGTMLGADLNDDLIAITTAGHNSLLATLDHGTVRGLVFLPSPSTQGFFRQYGTGCAAASSEIPFLMGSGTPAAGNSVGIHLRLAPATSFGVLAMGIGNVTIPLPSPTCQVQISPVFATASFFTTAAGAANFSLTLPSPFAPLDLYLQTGILDGPDFVVSNPLLMHTQ